MECHAIDNFWMACGKSSLINRKDIETNAYVIKFLQDLFFCLQEAIAERRNPVDNKDV